MSPGPDPPCNSRQKSEFIPLHDAASGSGMMSMAAAQKVSPSKSADHAFRRSGSAQPDRPGRNQGHFILFSPNNDLTITIPCIPKVAFDFLIKISDKPIQLIYASDRTVITTLETHSQSWLTPYCLTGTLVRHADSSSSITYRQDRDRSARSIRSCGPRFAV